MENVLGGVVAVFVIVLLIGWAIATVGKAAGQTVNTLAGNKTPARSSQYSDDSHARLQRATELMKQRMTCSYCGEMNMAGMKCANCGAKSPAA